jgi:hypothetical protein
MYRMILTINNDYVPKQYNRLALIIELDFLLWGIGTTIILDYIQSSNG